MIHRMIAFRYFLSRKNVGFVRVISLISVVGLTIGVAALVLILSVFNGFGGLVTSILVNFDPHLRIELPTKSPLADYAQLEEVLNERKDVAGYSPFVSGKALVVARNMTRVINVKGVDPSTVTKVSGLRDKLVLGSVDFGSDRSDGIVLGLTLADRLGVVVGDSVALVSPAGSDLVLLQLAQPLIRRFRVIGIYESNNKDYDGYYAFVRLATGQRLLGLGDKVQGIELRAHDLDEAGTVKAALEQTFGKRFRIQTWYDLHRELYSVMQIERWIAYIILSIIVGVASFNLLGSLTMTVIDKTRDIGILKTMGATPQTISKIFFLQGLMVGIAGAVFGLIIGLGLVYLQAEYHLAALDPTVYIIPAIPVEVHAVDLIVVPLTAIVLSSLAAAYPARRASRLVPVEAIRWE
jgi:lipoprotein-releasing system permease protein